MADPLPSAPDRAVAAALAELGCPHGPLAVGGIGAGELAARHGTPLYAFDAAVLRARLDRVRAAMGNRIEVLYSLKANPSVAVTAVVRQAGAGCEIASLGELEVARAAGFDPRSLRFAGPGKTTEELAVGLDQGLGTFHVESASELRELAALAARRGIRADVALRVNPGTGPAGARMRMAGASSRFGIDIAQVPGLLAEAHQLPSLRVRGLHVYGGTQLFDAQSFVHQATTLATHADAWERELGIGLDELDLGGGFGIATYAGDGSFDLDAAAAGIRDLVARHDRPGRRWFVELGRFLCGPAGVYLTRVVRTKESGGIRHAVVDGGMHHCAAAAGIGTVLRRPALLVTAAEPLGTGPAQTVGGVLCTPQDQFAEAMPLPALREGDLVAVLHAGAYGTTFSPTGFLSHPAPAEVLVDGGSSRVVRTRGIPADALRGQRW